MPTVRQSSFAGGEISPELYGRTDLPRYASALRTLKNVIVKATGVAQNRAGTKLVVRVKDAANPPRLIRFTYLPSQSYELEFGNLYVRFQSNGGPVLNPATGQPLEVVTPFTSAMLPYLNFTQSGDVMTICYGGQEPGGTAAVAPRDLTRVGHTNWTLALTSFAPFAAGNYDAGPPFTGLINPGNQPTATAPARPRSYAVTQLWKNNATGDVFETSRGVLIPQQAWDTFTTFALGDMVYSTTFDAIYTSLQAGNTNHDPTTSPTWWVKGVVAAPGLPTKLNVKPGVKAGYTLVGTRIFAGKPGGGTLAIVTAQFGLVAELDASGTYWLDEGETPDFTVQPPLATDPFALPGGGHDYPACVAYFEQRRVFARQGLHPQRIQTSKTGNFADFDTTFISQDDDALSFDLASLIRDEIRALVPLRPLVVLTQSGEWSVRGQPGNALSPNSVDARKHSEHGSSWVTPVVVGDSVVYVQDKGSTLHALTYDPTYDFYGGSYGGNELTAVARHFIDGHTVVQMAYAETPNRVLWIVRDDGVLLGATYAPDPQNPVVAWHQHSTDGTFLSVCVVPEGTEDVLYAVVKRSTGTFIERMQTRLVTDVRLGVFLDCALSYDGRNTGAVTMKFTSDTTYAGGEEGTILASAGSFTVDDVGRAIVLDPDAVASGPFRLSIIAYTDATHVRAVLDNPLPAALQAVATTSWGLARRTFAGLDHLEGKTVAVLADGAVATASRPGASLVVTAGQVVIDHAAVIVHAGLPYTSDLELLDVAGEKLAVKTVSWAALEVVASRGLYAGETFDKPLKQVPLGRDRDAWGNPALRTGIAKVQINATWNEGGRACFRQVDPLPLTVVAAIREVALGGK